MGTHSSHVNYHRGSSKQEQKLGNEHFLLVKRKAIQCVRMQMRSNLYDGL